MSKDRCPVSGGPHCKHRQADPEAPCCYCTIESGEEMQMPDDMVEGITKAAVEAAHEEGCTCEPDVELQPLVGAGGVKLVATELLHDDECALWQRIERAAKAPFN